MFIIVQQSSSQDYDEDKLTIKEEEFNPLESDDVSTQTSTADTIDSSDKEKKAEESVGNPEYWEAQSFHKQYGKKPRLESPSSSGGMSVLNKGSKPKSSGEVVCQPNDEYLKKKSTYHLLIRSALLGAENCKLSPAAIYSWCQKRYNYYAERNSHNASWKR